MENTEISNPILDEIPDACISDEMQEKLKFEIREEDSNRLKELEILRNYIVIGYEDLLERSMDLKTLGHKYYLNLSSTEIIKKFMQSHATAYEYCMRKARRKLGELCMIKNS